MEYIRTLVAEIGLDARRVRMVNLSAAMGGQFAQAVTEMVDDVREVGRNPLRVSNQ